MFHSLPSISALPIICTRSVVTPVQGLQLDDIDLANRCFSRQTWGTLWAFTPASLKRVSLCKYVTKNDARGLRVGSKSNNCLYVLFHTQSAKFKSATAKDVPRILTVINNTEYVRFTGNAMQPTLDEGETVCSSASALACTYAVHTHVRCAMSVSRLACTHLHNTRSGDTRVRMSISIPTRRHTGVQT